MRPPLHRGLIRLSRSRQSTQGSILAIPSVRLNAFIGTEQLVPGWGAREWTGNGTAMKWHLISGRGGQEEAGCAILEEANELYAAETNSSPVGIAPTGGCAGGGRGGARQRNTPPPP